MGVLAEIVHYLAMHIPQAMEHPLENLTFISHFYCMKGGHLNSHVHFVIDATSDEMKYIFMVTLLHFENLTFLFLTLVVRHRWEKMNLNISSNEHDCNLLSPKFCTVLYGKRLKC